jgi:hypothetical protein
MGRPALRSRCPGGPARRPPPGHPASHGSRPGPTGHPASRSRHHVPRGSRPTVRTRAPRARPHPAARSHGGHRVSHHKASHHSTSPPAIPTRARRATRRPAAWDRQEPGDHPRPRSRPPRQCSPASRGSHGRRSRIRRDRHGRRDRRRRGLTGRRCAASGRRRPYQGCRPGAGPFPAPAGRSGPPGRRCARTDSRRRAHAGHVGRPHRRRAAIPACCGLAAGWLSARSPPGPPGSSAP